MRRILEAAAAAARGGRRREINGAIVLAAIVGDGKSAAAQVLSALGIDVRRRHPRAAEQAGAGRRAAPAAGTRRRGDTRQRARARAIADGRDPAPRADGRSRATTRTSPRAAASRAGERVACHRIRARAWSLSRSRRAAEPPYHHQLRAGTIVRARGGTGVRASTAAAAPEHYQEAEPQYEPPATSTQPNFEGSYERARTAADAGLGAVPATAASARARRQLDAATVAAAPGQSRVCGRRAPPPRCPACRESAGRPARPGPPPLAPWPEEGGRRWASVRRGACPPAKRRATRGHLRRRRAAQAAPRPGARTVSPRTEIGQLVENIPRSMRVAVPALIEVRIARADVQALAEGLQGGGAAYQHEVMVTKAMSVRLRAPDGGFFIETASPETQWIERAMLLSSDDFASWRWHVTPRDKGRRRLQLIISARTVSADGLAAETALPDQVITVRVHTNYAKVGGALGWVGRCSRSRRPARQVRRGRLRASRGAAHHRLRAEIATRARRRCRRWWRAARRCRDLSPPT